MTYRRRRDKKTAPRGKKSTDRKKEWSIASIESILFCLFCQVLFFIFVLQSYHSLLIFFSFFSPFLLNLNFLYQSLENHGFWVASSGVKTEVGHSSPCFER